jgi:hypothetical protein
VVFIASANEEVRTKLIDFVPFASVEADVSLSVEDLMSTTKEVDHSLRGFRPLHRKGE